MIEKEMGNRGSKSVTGLSLYKPQTVKEQRVDGSWYCIYLQYLRCTLTDFKRSYPIKILSKQINRYSTTRFLPDKYTLTLLK
jgi:hypothetical protein